MTALQDLRELNDELDAGLTGWLRPSYSLMTTAIGRDCERMVRQMRERHYRNRMEIGVLRQRLCYALNDLDGQREMNAQLTGELETLTNSVVIE